MKRTSAELKRIARLDLRGRYGLCMGVMIVSNLITSALLMPFTFTLRPYYFTTHFFIYYMAVFIIGMMGSLLSSGVIRLQLRIARKEKPQFGDLFYAFTIRPDRIILGYVILSGTTYLLMVPGCLLFAAAFYLESVLLILLGGFCMLAAAAVSIFIGLAFGLVFMLLVDHPSLGAITAFRESYRLMKGNKGRMFYIMLSFIGWIILGTLSCYIGFLWIMPYMNQTLVSFYRDVTGELDHPQLNRECNLN